MKVDLPGIRHAQQAHIGQHFQFEMNVFRLAIFAGCGLARRAIGRGFEMQIAQAAAAAFADHDLFAIVGQVGENRIVGEILDKGADRNAQDNVVRAAPLQPAPRPGSPFLARKMRAKR